MIKYSRLKEASLKMQSLNVDQSIITLKQLQKDIHQYLYQKKVQQHDALSQLQITVFNNLACLYEKKGKYRTSLYHLQVAEELENKYFVHKFAQKKVPLQALERLSITYTNLSAAQSKLGNYKEAFLNAQFAIQILRRSQQSQNHPSFIHLYYNLSFLLDIRCRYQQAKSYALQGLQLAIEKGDKKMMENYQVLLRSLKSKEQKREARRSKETRKYVKGEIGVFKTRKQLQENSQKNVQTIKAENFQTDSEQRNTFLRKTITSNDNVVRLAKNRVARQTLTQNKFRANSQLETLTKKQRNYSVIDKKVKSRKQGTLISQTKFIDLSDSDIIAAEVEVDRSREAQQFQNSLLGVRLRGPQVKNPRQKALQFRIKQKKRRLNQEIAVLNQKNQVLQQILQKIYRSNNEASQS